MNHVCNRRAAHDTGDCDRGSQRRQCSFRRSARAPETVHGAQRVDPSMVCVSQWLGNDRRCVYALSNPVSFSRARASTTAFVEHTRLGIISTAPAAGSSDNDY